MVLVSALLSLISLFFLAKGAEWLLNGALSLSEKFHISPLIAATTIIAIGTGLPTIAVSLASIFSTMPNYDIAIGNIIGTNYVNLGLALGIPACLIPIVTQHEIFEKEIPIYLALFALLSSLTIGGALTHVGGIIILAFYMIVLFIIYQYAKKEQYLRELLEEENSEYQIKPPLSYVKSIGNIILGIIVLIISAFLLAYYAPFVGHALGISDYIMGLTIVGVGTSLPTIVAGIHAVKRHGTDIILGNVFGGNIANISLGLGLPALFHQLPFSHATLVDLSFTNIYNVVVLLLIMLEAKLIEKNKVLSRFDGLIIVGIYLVYIVYRIFGNKIFFGLF